MTVALLAAAFLAVCTGTSGGRSPADDEPIGPTPIPFYTGNLSVLPFMRYWGTHAGPITDLVDDGRIALLRRIACFADCDYQAWCLAEPEPGRWDFSMYRANADALHRAGLGYIPFCWVHFPPKWYHQSPDFVPYECAEHGEKLMQLSPWAPNIDHLYRQFYREQHRALGDRVTWMRVGTPSDYGEIGYPAAMTSWLVPQKHAHPGYWCGDRHARADFRAEMRRKFRSLAALNRRWGAAFASWDDVTYPEVREEAAARRARETGAPTDRRRWLDFVDWYNGVWMRFVPRLAGIIRAYYPKTPLIASLGYSSERTVYGNDYSAAPKMAKRIGIALQTPGAVSYYGVKRVATACHHYGCPFYTEPPGDVPPEAEVARVFCDVSCGVQVYFEYPQNLDRARPFLREAKRHMTGARPVVDVALWQPSVEHRLNAGEGNFPLPVFLLGEEGRDRFDYDVVDETLAEDGALRRYRVLVLMAGRVTEAGALRAIAAWVRGGGVLLTCDLGDVETVEGDRSLWRDLVPEGPSSAAGLTEGDVWDWPSVLRRCVRRVGRGAVIRLPAPPERRALLIDGVVKAAHQLADLGPRFRNAPLVDAAADGVRATLFADRVLYYNGTARSVTKRVRFRPEDWRGRCAHPAEMDVEVELPPHTIRAIPLVEGSEKK